MVNCALSLPLVFPYSVLLSHFLFNPSRSDGTDASAPIAIGKQNAEIHNALFFKVLKRQVPTHEVGQWSPDLVIDLGPFSRLDIFHHVTSTVGELPAPAISRLPPLPSHLANSDSAATDTASSSSSTSRCSSPCTSTCTFCPVRCTGLRLRVRLSRLSVRLPYETTAAESYQ